MSTIYEMAQDLRRQDRERRDALALARRAEDNLTDEDRAVLFSRIYARLFPLKDWHDDKPTEILSMFDSATAQEARDGLASQPQTWK